MILEKAKGAIAEVSVYKGESALLLAKAFPDRIIYLFDTFSGMPESDPSIDYHKKGDFADTSLSAVMTKLKDFKNVIYYPGIFPESAKTVENIKFAFVNVDVDIYKSTKDCLEFFYPRLAEGGGIFIQDDYNFPNCKGATKAVDEFLQSQNLKLRKIKNSVWIGKE